MTGASFPIRFGFDAFLGEIKTSCKKIISPREPALAKKTLALIRK